MSPIVHMRYTCNISLWLSHLCKRCMDGTCTSPICIWEKKACVTDVNSGRSARMAEMWLSSNALIPINTCMQDTPFRDTQMREAGVRLFPERKESFRGMIVGESSFRHRETVAGRESERESVFLSVSSYQCNKASDDTHCMTSNLSYGHVVQQTRHEEIQQRRNSLLW